ncbi:alkaline phosphatase D family protein [Rhodococcus aerolatus]
MTDVRPALVLGPLLRHVDRGSATVWVEVDRPATVTVTVRGGDGDAVTATEPTWGVHGHHFALVVCPDLDPGSDDQLTYTVELDGHRAWPAPQERPGVIRVPAADGVVRLAFGSCRRGEGYTDADLALVGADALVALAASMARTTPDQWPDALLLLGDQVYADDPSERIRLRLRERRAAGMGPEGARRSGEVADEICDFEEYSWLYRESWSAPEVRWLLASVPTAMILDDHDLRDDWNTSQSWREEVGRAPWWDARVVGAFSSYWVYQHLGNLTPAELARDELYAAVRAAPDDAAREALLADFARRADAEPTSARWSFRRDLGRTRLLVLDSRCSRRLDPDDRAMVDDAEWAWFREQALEPGAEHLLVASTLPVLLLPGIHHLEGWNEATAAGRWGGRAARLAEKIRQDVDLEHWAAFRTSFDAMVDLVRDVAAEPDAPASVLWLSGDVHCSYLAAARVEGLEGDGAPAVHQLTMSPFRNPLNLPIQVANKVIARPGTTRALRRLARAAGVTDPGVEWDVTDGPWFDNGVMTVVLDGRAAAVAVDHAFLAPTGEQLLRRTAEQRLAGSVAAAD